MRGPVKALGLVGALAVSGFQGLIPAALASSLKVAGHSAPPAPPAVPEALSSSDWSLGSAQGDFKEAGLEEVSFGHAASTFTRWHSRKLKHKPILLIASLLAAALTVSFLVLKCYKHFRAANPSDPSKSRRLATGGQGQGEGCGSDDDGGDDKGNGNNRHVVIEMGDPEEAEAQPAQGSRGRLRGLLSRLASFFIRRRLPPAPLEQVVVHTPQQRVYTALPPPELTSRLFAGHFGGALVSGALIGSLALPQQIATGITAFFVGMLGLEELLHGMTGGRLQLTEWLLQRFVTREPPNPNARLPPTIMFRFGWLFFWLGFQTLFNTAYTMIVEGSVDPSLIVPIVGGLLVLFTGIDQLLYGVTNGRIDLGFYVSRDPPPGYYDIVPGDPLPRALRLWETEFPQAPPPQAQADRQSETSERQSPRGFRDRANAAAASSSGAPTATSEQLTTQQGQRPTDGAAASTGDTSGEEDDEATPLETERTERNKSKD